MEKQSLLERLKLPWWQWLGYFGVLILTVFMILPSSYFLMVTFPPILLWQAGFLCLGIALLGLIRQFELPFHPLGYGLDWAVLAVAIACILSTIFAPFPGVAAWQLVTVIGYGVALYALRNFLGRGGWNLQNIWRFWVILGAGMSIWAIAGWLNIGRPDRNLFPIGHHNFVGAYFCLMLPLILSFVLSVERPIKKIALFLPLCIPSVFVIYTSSSRGAFLGLLIWAIATISFVIWRTKGKKRLILSSLSAGILTLLLIVGLQHPRVQRVIQVDGSGGLPAVEFKVDGQTEDRLFMWRSGLNILRDRPLTGAGLGNMSRIYNLYRPITVGAGAAHIQQLHGTPPHLLAELGLIGGAAIAFLLFQLIRLGWKIQSISDSPQMKRLVYGVGGSWLAYGGASLTDYQLENIAISFPLLLTVILLIAAADQTLPTQPQTLATPQRRILSLGSLGGMFIALFAVAPTTWSMNLFSSGRLAWEQGQNEKAFIDMATASEINRWNPNYALYIAFWFLENRTYQEDSPEDYQKSTELAAEYLLKGLEAAPNDFYFNQNVGILLAELDLAQAQTYLERSIQLLPRDPVSSNYFMLGLSHLAQGNEEKAIAALALQCLMSPAHMTLGNWDREPLAQYRVATVEKCIALHEELIARLDPEDDIVLSLKERIARMSWWHDLPIPYLDELEEFPTVVQVLLLGDRQPEKALSIVEAELAAAPEDNLWLILRAYFDEKYPLALSYEETPGQITQYELVKPTDPDINLQKWLRQIPSPPRPPTDRLASQLVYRSQDFTGVDAILHPKNLKRFRLVGFLNLDSRFPRSLPALDHLVNEVNRDELGLPHPTQNGFKLLDSDI
ncbi:O-antigen polymerase [[Leptolyngbya] sp. PCC 7376]|uniref:O-antigen ligase family protein n=1 Tax=[Leptolyngbya] sp. PCC 7376 TaxID=111781 RepID=UPI00029EF5E3|nr:O-antigen ligase family protein [[Leptolyngbya] sp. PCC 7376]AFY36945.1 O-antigen polymerase [[Leptolyngbya] sp. PCC 7376]